MLANGDANDSLCRRWWSEWVTVTSVFCEDEIQQERGEMPGERQLHNARLTLLNCERKEQAEICGNPKQIKQTKHTKK